MILSRYTAPTLYPVTREELMLHLRIDDDTGYEDELLDDIMYASISKVESITRRKLLTQTWDYYLQNWPDVDYIKLPFGNLQTVTSVSWKDDDGTETTLTVTTDYLVETNGEGIGRIVLPYGEDWPSDTLYPSNPIKIRYTCGWTAAASVPYEIKAAIKYIAGDIYTNRESQYIGMPGQKYEPNPNFLNMLNDYRLWDEF